MEVARRAWIPHTEGVKGVWWRKPASPSRKEPNSLILGAGIKSLPRISSPLPKAHSQLMIRWWRNPSLQRWWLKIRSNWEYCRRVPWTKTLWGNLTPPTTWAKTLKTGSESRKRTPSKINQFSFDSTCRILQDWASMMRFKIYWNQFLLNRHMRQYLAMCLWSACLISFNRTACMQTISIRSPRGIKATLIVTKMKKKTSTPVSVMRNLLRLFLRPSLHSMRTYLWYSVQNT